MKKTVYMAGFLPLIMSAGSVAENLGRIEVESTKLSDVSGEEVKSADLAEALTRNLPSVSIVRRSGIANDIILRGQKKDNINILFDNAKIYGACPNRMDPPTSHVLTNTIESIEVIEGPYDVENFGTLSGAIEITTKKPSEDFKGEVSVNLASFDYKKAAATVSGGSESVRFLLSVSNEISSQYKDGDGNTFAQQIDNLNPSSMPAMDPRLKAEYNDIDAYKKSAVLAKIFLDLTDKQQLKLSYTANRSDDVIYASSKMDALYDDSNIFNVEYTINDLSEYSKSLDVQFYKSDVDHPMSTFYRVSSAANSVNEKISALSADMQGVKVKNEFDLSARSTMTLGIDNSIRNWHGSYEGKGTQLAISGLKSIPDVDTENKALFIELERKYSELNIKVAARYDDTSITPSRASAMPSNDYSGISANVFARYDASDSVQYFAGIGQASRVPDARELYFKGAMISGAMVMAPLWGTPTLDETQNTEIDFGVDNRYDDFNIKTKLFYSQLKNYIYYNSSVISNKFENIDATIYGLEISGSYFVMDEAYLDFGLAYQKGEKDQALAGQSDKDLAEIPPMKINLALNYDYSHKNTARIEVLSVADWRNFDADNGEQSMPAYTVVNMKVRHDIMPDIELSLGIDNVFDKSYATTNTYKDLTLLADGSGDVMLINEPARYLYANVSYKF